MIPVTRPDLPQLDELSELLGSIWDSRHVTNCGLLHEKLESLIARRSLSGAALCSNGTMALLAMLSALKMTGGAGEIITTPFTFPATAHAITLAGFKPVFVDVDPLIPTLSPARVEEAITEETVAILDVHCFGRASQIQALTALSKHHGINLFFDAAHAFGVEFEGQPLWTMGDASALSFHATKVFSTIEGGAVISSSDEIIKQVKLFRNFGIESQESVPEVGLNAKMSELHAAVGLLNISKFDKALEMRREIERRYAEMLADVQGVSLIPHRDGQTSNGSYMPVLIRDALHGKRDLIHEQLVEAGVGSRKYFWPCLTNTEPYESSWRGSTPIADGYADDVLCLPIYPDLSESEQDYVVSNVQRICAELK